MNIRLATMLATLVVVGLAGCGSGSGDDSFDDPNDVMNGDGSGGGSNGGGSGDTGGGNVPASFGEPNESLIRPGVGITADGSFCTSNFIFGDAAGNYYIGAAAHCFSPDTNSGVNACETRNLEIGSAVEIENADHMGSLYYSSWRAMQDNQETSNSDVCAHNDFALVKIDSRDTGKVHPAAIAFQGPVGLLRGGASAGEEAYSYGQSPLHNGLRINEEKTGSVRGVTGNGWLYSVSFDNPGLPGDSGSAVLHETGKALGVLTVVSVGISLTPVSNGVMNLEMGFDYANDYLSNDVRLVAWERFTP